MDCRVLHGFGGLLWRGVIGGGHPQSGACEWEGRRGLAQYGFVRCCVHFPMGGSGLRLEFMAVHAALLACIGCWTHLGRVAARVAMGCCVGPSLVFAWCSPRRSSVPGLCGIPVAWGSGTPGVGCVGLECRNQGGLCSRRLHMMVRRSGGSGCGERCPCAQRGAPRLWGPWVSVLSCYGRDAAPLWGSQAGPGVVWLRFLLLMELGGPWAHFLCPPVVGHRLAVGAGAPRAEWQRLVAPALCPSGVSRGSPRSVGFVWFPWLRWRAATRGVRLCFTFA